MKNPASKAFALGRPFWCLLILVAFTASGCWSKKVPINIEWPTPPDKARVRYMRPIRASSDVERRSTFQVLVDIILGGQERIYVIKKPYGVNIDPSGRLLVADTGWGKILVFDLPQHKFSFIGEGPKGQLSKPAGIATDRDGTIYVSDLLMHRVFVYDRDGNFQRALGMQKRFKQPVGVAVDRENRMVYVVDMKSHQVVVFDTEGKELRTIGKRGNGDGEFNYPSNATVAANGDLYVVDSFNFRVQHFDKHGKFIGKWGKLGNLPGMFARPKGIAIDPDGHIYVADAAYHNVQMFTPDGRLLMFVGAIGRDIGQFYLPAGIDIAPDGRIFVANQLNRRIDVLLYLGGGEEPEEAAPAPEPSGTAPAGKPAEITEEGLAEETEAPPAKPAASEGEDMTGRVVGEEAGDLPSELEEESPPASPPPQNPAP